MVDCMLTSGHVPLYHPDLVKTFRGRSYIDGCVSNNSPIPMPEHPSKVFQIRSWRTILPHWILIYTCTDWAKTQFEWGRADAIANIHEIEHILHYKEAKEDTKDEEDAKDEKDVKAEEDTTAEEDTKQENHEQQPEQSDGENQSESSVKDI